MPEVPSLESIIATLEQEADTIQSQQAELAGRLQSLRDRVKDLSKRLTQMVKGPTNTGTKRGRKPKVVEPTAPTAVAAE